MSRHSSSSLDASRRRFLWLGATAVAGWSPARAASPDAQALLALADAVRNPGKPFALTNTLLEYKDGKQKDTLTLRAYSSIGGANNQFRSLVRYEAPQQDVGKLMLKEGSNIWFFDPASKATIRISPQQKLIGQAANGDVVTTSFAADYLATLDGDEAITDGERHSVACRRLALTARGPETTYPRALLWVAQDGNRPVKAQFYVDSGKLLKTAYYRRLQPVLGAQRPTETVLIDGLDPSWITVMRFDQYAWRDVPEAWLQRDYLARFKPE